MDLSTVNVQRDTTGLKEINFFAWMLMSVLMRMEDAPTNATTPWDHMNVAALLIKFLVMTRRLVSLLLNARYVHTIVKLHRLE